MATYRDLLPTRQAASSRKRQWNRGMLLLLLSHVQHGCWRSRSLKPQNCTVQGDNQQDWPTGTDRDGFVPGPLQNCVPHRCAADWLLSLLLCNVSPACPWLLQNHLLISKAEIVLLCFPPVSLSDFCKENIGHRMDPSRVQDVLLFTCARASVYSCPNQKKKADFVDI